MNTTQLTTEWQYLERRSQSWRQQLYFKGRKLTAFAVCMDMMVNGETPQEAADNWDLPLAAVQEAITYCETHHELLKQEAEIERRSLEELGVCLEPQVTH